MLFQEVRETKLDVAVMSHLIWRNASIGVELTYGLDDLIHTYEQYQKFISYQDWLLVTEVKMKKMIINTKMLALEKILRLLREVDDLDEKRGYLLDAMNIERQIFRITYGE